MDQVQYMLEKGALHINIAHITESSQSNEWEKSFNDTWKYYINLLSSYHIENIDFSALDNKMRISPFQTVFMFSPLEKLLTPDILSDSQIK